MASAPLMMRIRHMQTGAYAAAPSVVASAAGIKPAGYTTEQTVAEANTIANNIANYIAQGVNADRARQLAEADAAAQRDRDAAANERARIDAEKEIALAQANAQVAIANANNQSSFAKLSPMTKGLIIGGSVLAIGGLAYVALSRGR